MLTRGVFAMAMCSYVYYARTFDAQSCLEAGNVSLTLAGWSLDTCMWGVWWRWTNELTNVSYRVTDATSVCKQYYYVTSLYLREWETS